MKVKLLRFFLVCWMLNCFAFPERVAGQRVFPDRPTPVIKNGRFVFYNPAWRRDTLRRLVGSASPSTNCFCGLTSAAKPKHFVVAGDRMVLYITEEDATCGYGSGSVIVQVTNGTLPYSYTETYYGITSIPQNTGNFPVMGAGDYIMTVTDATGATVSANITVNNTLPGPVLVPYTFKNPSGCDVSDAEVTLQPFGGQPPYTYSMDRINFQTNNTFTNLHSGTYNFFVKDANGCIGIQESVPLFLGYCTDLFVGISYSLGECHNDGLLELQQVNPADNRPLQYSLDGGSYQSSRDFTNIGPGIHLVSVKDNDGNLEKIGFNIPENCTIAIQFVTVDAACQQDNGVLTVTASNGTAPYSYTIDGINYQSSNVFTDLAPGNYYVTVKDGTGVKSSQAATVYDRCPVVRTTVDPESCAGSNGVITAGGFKGTAPYQFSIDGINFQTNNVFPGLTAGTYTITLRDALGFSSTVQSIVPSACLHMSVTTTNSTCDKNNGGITTAVSGGIAPYQYSIDGSPYQSSNLFSGLSAGLHSISVKDAGAATGTTTATILGSAGAGLSLTATGATCSNDDGAVMASAVGGESPFMFSADGINYQADGLFSGLDTGTKMLYIQDANGCENARSIVIALNDDLTTAMGNDPTICEGRSVKIDAVSNGGSFSWLPLSGLDNADALNPVASPTKTTKYYLKAIRGICQQLDSITVFVNPAPVPDAGSDTTICIGQSVRLHGGGGAQYQWSPSTYLSSAQDPNPLVDHPAAGISYALSVTNANGCGSLQTAQVTVGISPQPVVFAGNDTAVLVGQLLPLNAIDVDGSGFTGYRWTPSLGLNNPLIADPVALIANDIVYVVVASTAKGCEGRDSIYVKTFSVSDIFVPNAFTPNGDGRNDLLHVIPIGIRELENFSVFNRWGQRMFFTKDAGQGWDGTVGGVKQDSGAYVWMASGIDFQGRTIRREGTFVLIR